MDLADAFFISAWRNLSAQAYEAGLVGLSDLDDCLLLRREGAQLEVYDQCVSVTLLFVIAN